MRVLATLLRPDAGRAEVFGHDVVADAPLVREQLGLTGQFAAVDEILTGRENLEMFGRLFDLPVAEARRRAQELLERFDLADAADRPARTYSGGMRRRLDLASSLLTRPRILFLDEPTTGLDPRSRNQIWTVARELVSEGTTILLTTQYLDEADELADRIAVIDHGRVIAEGTGNELKDRVGGQILEVELASTDKRDEARAVLARLGCGEPEPDDRPDRLTVPAPRDGLAAIEDVAAALREARHRRRANWGCAGRRSTTCSCSSPGRRRARTGTRRRGWSPPRRRVERTHRRLFRFHRPTVADLRSAVSDSWVVTARNLRHFIRQPQLLIFSTIQPVMFVILFSYVFGGAVKGSLPKGLDYVDFLLPGILVQSVTFRATQTAIGLAEDLQRGVVDRFRSMPMARSAVLVGRTVADLVRNVLILGLMIVVGYLVGFRFHAGFLDALGCIAVVSAFGLRLELDLRLRGARGEGRGGGAVGRVRGGVPARVRELGVRPGLEHAGLAPDIREGEPGHAHRQHGAQLRARRRGAGLAGRRGGLDRRAAARVHPAVRVALQADELTLGRELGDHLVDAVVVAAVREPLADHPHQRHGRRVVREHRRRDAPDAAAASGVGQLPGEDLAEALALQVIADDHGRLG